MERLKLDIQKFGGNYSVTASVISQDIANNRSTVRITATSSTTYDTWNEDWDGYIQGSYSGAASGNLSRQYVYLPHWSSYSVSWDITVSHNADGTCGQVNINCYHYITDNTNGWSSTSVTPATIPRYTTVSTWSVKSRTETSITMSWKTADNVSAIKYGINTSSPTTVSNLNKNSGEVTISGLTEGQTYTLYFMPQRKDSGLWGDGSGNTWKSLTNQSPIPYPYCSSAPNFTIGNNVTLQLYNPLNRPLELQMYSFVGRDFINFTKISTNANGEFSFPASNYTQQLYDSIPEAKSSQYNIDVWYNGHKSINGGNSYSVDENNCRPTFSDFTYADTNATTVTLTGNNQKVVRGYSNITATISTANKATVATGKGSNIYMKRYDLIIDGNSTNNANYSDNSDVTITTNGANSGSIKVSAVDSRNIVREVPKTADVIPYTNIQRGNISVKRAGNVGEATTLAFDGTLWEGNFGSVTNTITSVQYRYKSTAAGSSWSAYASLTSPTPSGNSYSFSGLIAGDEGNTGFTVDNSFNIEVVVSDRLSSITFTATLGTGVPHIAIADDGIAIKQPYDTNESAVLQVNGRTVIKGNLKATGAGYIGGALTTGSGATIGSNSTIAGSNILLSLDNSTNNYDTYLKVNASWASKSMGFGIGGGGVNRGIWDWSLSKWTFYLDDSKLYSNGNTEVKGNLNTTGSLQVSSTNVVASGSTTNGYYVKYYDGTMICWGGKSGTTTFSDWWSFCNRSPEGTSAISQTLPQNFKDTNYRVVVTPDHSSVIASCSIANRYTSSFQVICFKPKGASSTSSVANTYAFSWVAVGKWK